MESWWYELKAFDRIKVYKVDTSDNPGREAIALGWLNAEELERRNQFIPPGPKRRFALCRAALRSILCELIGCDNADLKFEEAEQGKPYATLTDRKVDVAFNVSHSGDHGLIATGEVKHLGIDIEERSQRRDFDLLLSSVLGPGEQSHIASAGEEQKHDLFFDYWTVKEAVLKSIGVGMSLLDPSLIEVPPQMLQGDRCCLAQYPQIGHGTWRIENLGTKEYAAALAYLIDQ